MKLRLRDEEIPYPLFTIKGRLRLSGLSDSAISEVFSSFAIGEIETEEILLNHIREALESYESSLLTNFETLTKYESLRVEFPELPVNTIVPERNLREKWGTLRGELTNRVLHPGPN